MTPGRIQPALLGGLFIGVLSALPVVSLGNVCCCLWLVVGGVLAAWVMQQNHPDPVTPADGAVVGLLAGIVGAFVYLLIAWPMTLIVGPMMDEWLERVVESAGDVPMRDLLERYRGQGARAIGVVVGFIMQLGLGAIFSTLGGVLGAMLFKRPAVPPAGPPASWGPPSLPAPPGSQG